ncbi:bifunctional UDP-sugar hydrolase/5'-nucleotidase [Lentisphaera profundi]|uniref:Bifunctional UDP-sugar hydrolase/5'-nucleotidase n=1 Tax=Lentisphaera profundi TaxID=1658616 RepID=A0ABY7VSY1_9BACT|nr:bifunctional UDP-sugar hydrolase/5'-nucleotidase [Lentisphaera profundi]WDE95889.1 bifunctional UDP-sugar hydrolase/5'-nucleotidase [Lentisphaera profundi]
MKDKLTLLYTTDLHGFLVADSYLADQKSSNGLIQAASIIKRIRRDEKEVIYFDNGDTLSGSLVSLRYGEDMRFSNPMVNALNDLSCAFSVVGNHEFDFGRKYLDKAVEQSDFPWLATNLVKNRGGSPAFGPSWHLQKVASGKSVAFIGLTTPETAELAHEDAIKGLSFLDPVDVLGESLKEIKKLDVDLIVVSFHGGYDSAVPYWSQKTPEDLDLKSKICQKYPEIDVLITGHTHGLLSNREINGVHTIQAGCYGHHVGRVDISWDGEDKSIQSENIPVKGQRLEKNLLESSYRVLESTVEWLDEPIGESLDDFSFTSSREALMCPSRLMSLVHMVIQDASNCDISAAAFWKLDGWKAGTITRRTILNLVPDNYLHVLSMTGKTLRKALEQSLSFFECDESGEVEPGSRIYTYDIWSGIYYKADLANKPGRRIKELTYLGESVSDDQILKVAFYHFRTNGALGYEMLQDAKLVWQSKKTMRDYLLEFMKKNYELSVPIEFNWKLMSGETLL